MVPPAGIRKFFVEQVAGVPPCDTPYLYGNPRSARRALADIFRGAYNHPVQRDTKANLIFLSVFLALSLPGAVILFKKKLEPGTPAAFMPPAVRTRLPYLSPMDAPDLQRYVPERTGAWVAEVARAHGYPNVASADGLPVISEGRRVQLVGTAPENRAGLMIWDDASTKVVITDGTGHPVEVRQTETIAVPEPVRKELIVAGFSKPPHHVLWVDAVPHERPERLRVHMGDSDESVPRFTK
jgi:hypothetical protein